jgi:hypothetical protein
MTCPAGRARSAWPPRKRRPVCGDPGSGGHFVAGVPCRGGTTCGGSPVGRNERLGALRAGFLARGEDAIADGSGFDGGTDVVGAEDVGAGQDRGYIGGGGGLEAVFHGGCGSIEQDGEGRVLGEGVGEEALP